MYTREGSGEWLTLAFGSQQLSMSLALILAVEDVNDKMDAGTAEPVRILPLSAVEFIIVCQYAQRYVRL